MRSMSEPGKESFYMDMDVLEMASLFARTMYASEPCRICGKLIEGADVKNAAFVGYSAGDAARSAHRECSLKKLPKEQWAYPQDSEKRY